VFAFDARDEPTKAVLLPAFESPRVSSANQATYQKIFELSLPILLVRSPFRVVSKKSMSSGKIDAMLV
jgi:hypothetical protein